jgi:hypothetical protein
MSKANKNPDVIHILNNHKNKSFNNNTNYITKNNINKYGFVEKGIKISKRENNIIKLKINDLLVVITNGEIKSGIIRNPCINSIIADEIADEILILRLKNNSRNIFVISIFLMSKYGISQIKNATTDTNTINNNITTILNSVKIPLWHLSFEEKIEEIYFEAIKNNSLNLMTNAIQIVEHQWKKDIINSNKEKVQK